MQRPNTVGSNDTNAVRQDSQFRNADAGDSLLCYCSSVVSDRDIPDEPSKTLGGLSQEH
jgi:hypothetical protein